MSARIMSDLQDLKSGVSRFWRKGIGITLVGVRAIIESAAKSFHGVSARALDLSARLLFYIFIGLKISGFSMGSSCTAFRNLADRIISCERCPRLRTYCEEITKVKKKAFMEWNYWGKPLPGFGDSHARLLIIGLAPAAHGGNRTGRMFTGDRSGDWLIKALYEAGLANQSASRSRDDGLELRSAYIAATVRCAPPGNKPVSKEIKNCSSYLTEELKLLKEVEIILALGRIAFDSYLKHRLDRSANSKPAFKHGALYDLGSTPLIMASYHPSRQNTQTNKLTWQSWTSIFDEIRRVIA
jgi:uracil-DNA glycosylase family 4